MAQRQPAFLDALQKYDPDFYKAVSAFREASRGKALDAKTGILISLALDAALGARDGVKNIARMARAQGVTDDEIRETLRIAATAKMYGALVVSANAFAE